MKEYSQQSNTDRSPLKEAGEGHRSDEHHSFHSSSDHDSMKGDHIFANNVIPMRPSQVDRLRARRLSTRTQRKRMVDLELLAKVEYKHYTDEFDCKKFKGAKRHDENKMTFEEYVQSAEFLREDKYLFDFDQKRFLKYWFANFLFFVFGPFSLIIILPLYGEIDSHNMGFIGLHQETYIQYVTWMLFAYVTVIFFGLPPDHAYATEYQSILIQIIFRSIIVGVRYGYCTDARMKLQKCKKMTFKELSEDYSLTAWKNIDLKNLEYEVGVSIVRERIDHQFFHFNFLEDFGCPIFSKYVKMDWGERKDHANVNFVCSSRKNKNKYKKSQVVQQTQNVDTEAPTSGTTEVYYPDEEEDEGDFLVSNNERIKGRHLLRELVLHSKNNPMLFKFFFFGCFLVAIVPTIYRGGKGYTVYGQGPVDGLYYISTFLLNLQYNILNFLFFSLTYADLQRRLFLMRSLSVLISVHKDRKFANLAYLPTIDVYEPNNILSWMNLRILSFDLGKKYSKRSYAYTSIMVICYFILAFWLVLVLFGLVNTSKEDTNVQAIMTGCLLFIIFVFLALILVKGAQINDCFKTHKDLLLRNMNYYQYVFEHSSEICSDVRYINKMLLYAAYKFDMTRRKELERKMRALVTISESLVERLNNDELKNPYKIAGVKVDWLLIGQLATIIASLFMFILQYHINFLNLGS
mmetsp:Transcript_24924/g.28461  ORF Transcript_24924/g.28461 Transcript_24924/m.28461 type:complete len:689 (-) Transcript_24924:8-2074(-)